MASTCILVLGTPRSGTSCVAGILHHLGVPMYAPNCVGDPNDANPKGFFTDTEFEAFCNQKYGTYFPDRRNALTIAEREYLARMIEARRQPIWGVKEWRIAAFLPRFIELAGDVKIVRMTRPAARSMQSWNEHFTRLKTVTLEDLTRANTYIDQAVAAANVPTLTIGFDEMLDSKETVLASIAAFVGRTRNANANGFIDESFRRF